MNVVGHHLVAAGEVGEGAGNTLDAVVCTAR